MARLGLGQLCSSDDKQENLRKCTALVEEAVRQRCAVLSLPECFAFMASKPGGATEAAEPLAGELMQHYKALASHHNIWLCLGLSVSIDSPPALHYPSHQTCPLTVFPISPIHPHRRLPRIPPRQLVGPAPLEQPRRHRQHRFCPRLVQKSVSVRRGRSLDLHGPLAVLPRVLNNAPRPDERRRPPRDAHRLHRPDDLLRPAFPSNLLRAPRRGRRRRPGPVRLHAQNGRRALGAAATRARDREPGLGGRRGAEGGIW